MFDFDQSINQSGSAGLSVDIADPATACRAGAVVVGATVVVGSVGITTMAAPAVTLIPAAVAGGMWIAADQIRNNATANADKSEPAAA